jgi:hypothetical protein
LKPEEKVTTSQEETKVEVKVTSRKTNITIRLQTTIKIKRQRNGYKKI